MNDQTDDREWCDAFAQQLIGVEETLEGTRRQLALALKEGRHKRLGKTEDEFCRELGAQVMRDREERQAFTKALTEEGFTQRQIAAVAGVSHVTIGRDLNGTNVPKPTEQPKEESEASGTNVPKAVEVNPTERRAAAEEMRAIHEEIELWRQKYEPQHGKSVTGRYAIDEVLLLGMWLEKVNPPFTAVRAPVLAKIGSDLWAKWISDAPSIDMTDECNRLDAWSQTQEFNEVIARAPDLALSLLKYGRRWLAANLRYSGLTESQIDTSHVERILARRAGAGGLGRPCPRAT
jgi:transcriptional regulator with XRE-family HTH domain